MKSSRVSECEWRQFSHVLNVGWIEAHGGCGCGHFVRIPTQGGRGRGWIVTQGGRLVQ
jgi:hypothetical protein